MLLLIFVSFLFITLIENSFVSNNKVFALNPTNVSAPVSSLSINDLSSVEVNVKLDGNRSNFGPNYFSGDSIKQIPSGSGNYYIVNNNSQKVFQVPSYINIDIEDIANGEIMPTYGCVTSSGSNYNICPKVNGHYIATLGADSNNIPYFDTGAGVISYSAYFAIVNDNGSNNSSYNFIACISGTNISDFPSCSLNKPNTSYWTVQSCNKASGNGLITSTCDTAFGVPDSKMLNIGGGQESFNKNKASVIGLSLPLPSSYKTPTSLVNQLNSTNNTPQPQAPTCESSSGSILGWMICPLINWVASAEYAIEGIIANLLKTPTISTSSNPQAASYTSNLKTVWNNFRNIANIILVIIILVIVFGESIGGGLIDAYSIRKILPRIIIGAILINISFYVVIGLEDIINILGGGIAELISKPFQLASGPGLPQVNIGAGSAGLALGIGALGVAAVATQGALAFIFFTAVAAFIAALIVAITLLIRQALIVLLIILSPIAFALYILPNTQSVFKRWWDLLFKALLMYPIIMIFFAMGKIAAYVVQIIKPSGDATLYSLLAVIAIILPLFLVPQAFKMAGGAIGSLHGAITGLGHKQFLANARKQNRQNRINRAMSGGFENRGIGRLYNRIGTGARAGWRGRFGVGERGRAALTLDAAAQTEETLKNNHKLAQLRNDDDANAVMALSGGSRDGALEAARELFGTDNARINNAMRKVDAVGLSKANASAALQTMAQNKSRSIGDGRYDLIQNGITRLAGGNGTQSESIAQQFQFLSREAGRGDIGGMWANQAVQDRARQLENSLGISRQEAMQHAVALDAMSRMDPASLARGHANQTRQFARTASAIYTAASAADAPPELKMMGAESASRLLEMQKNLSYASGENQGIINTAIYSVGVDYGQTRTAIVDGQAMQVPVSIEDQLAGGLNWVAQGNQAFNGQELNKMSRTYSGDQILPGGQRGPGAET